QCLRAHCVQGLAIECAEAVAEMLHARLRTQWGFPDPADLSIGDKLKAHYRGISVSFGYPACPNLGDQRVLFDLLRPDQIGLDLTDGFMMDPEASVSALVFHHPEARYFKANDDGEESRLCRPRPASALDFSHWSRKRDWPASACWTWAAVGAGSPSPSLRRRLSSSDSIATQLPSARRASARPGLDFRTWSSTRPMSSERNTAASAPI